MTAPVRTLIVWIPDWPVIALSGELQGGEAALPVAVFEKGKVRACSPAARAEGVREGQRRRDAQARCPQLVAADADPARDHRVFSPVIARIEQLAPGVQLREPGLCVLHARGPARYYGGEAAAATVLSGVVAEFGLPDVRVGVADGPFAAEQAARRGTAPDAPVRIVPVGQAAAFLAPLPVTVLEDESVSLFARLGVQTLGAMAALPVERMVERFGPRGARLHALASGRDTQGVTPRTPPAEHHRELFFEPPLEVAEQVAFAMRMPAEEFVAGLGAVDLVCTELRVILRGEGGELSDRVWLHPGAFDASAVVDRVRWQLAEQGLRSRVEKVRIEPEGVDAVSHHTARLFGSGPEERVHHALSRVQAMLGHRSVLTADIGGGRWLSERQVLVPWGDSTGDSTGGTAGGGRRADRRAAPWPGRLPGPLPATVFRAALPVEVVDEDGDTVAVDARGELTGIPAMLVWEGRSDRIQSWAGPWPLVERGWDPARSRHAHRFQVVDVRQGAWLLVCEQGAWQVEGRYD